MKEIPLLFGGRFRGNGRGELPKCILGGKIHRSSGHDTPEDAAMAYDVMARKLHGEFAYQNFRGKK